MTPSEIVLECEKRNIKLRVNPTDKKLTATPRKAVPAELLTEMRNCRPELVAYLEEMAKQEGDLTIEDVAPPPPPELSIPEKIINKARELNIEITLHPKNAEGMLKIITPWEQSEVPELLKGVRGVPEDAMRRRQPVPHQLAALIQSHHQELTWHLRAPYLPPPPPEEPGEDPSKRSIFERMAMPDNLFPNAKDNQARVKSLLFGPNAASRALKERFDSVDRSLIALTIPRLKGKK